MNDLVGWLAHRELMENTHPLFHPHKTTYCWSNWSLENRLVQMIRYPHSFLHFKHDAVIVLPYLFSAISTIWYIYIYPKFTNFAPVKYWWLEDDRFLKWGFPGVLPSPPLIDPNPCCDLCVIQTCTKKVEIVRNVRNVHLQTSHVFPKMWRHLVIFGQLKPTFMKWNQNSLLHSLVVLN